MVLMQSIEPTNIVHDEFCERADYHYDQRPSNPIGTIYDLNSGRVTVVEFNGRRSLAEILKADQPKTKGKIKRGAERSFREVSPSGELEPNLAYTISQAAEYLQYSEDLVLKLCKDRTFKSTQRENAYRIKGSVILDYLEPK